ncbi:MAG: DUF6797 domain-containing protein [Verrucomicrobiales bacterium]
MTSSKLFSLVAAIACFAASSQSQDKAHLELDSPFGSFVEDAFPFFCQTLDAREFGENPEPTNLTPRGIIVKLGDDHYGCFDPDLLRWSLIWKANEDGEYLTMDGMGTGSYRLPNRKAPPGQDSLPKPIGTPVSATPALPGWSVGDKPADRDPRERGGSDEGEVGLGPIPAEMGRFSGIRLIQDGISIEYTVAGTPVVEAIRTDGDSIAHSILIESRKETLRRLESGGEWKAFEPNPDPQRLVVSRGLATLETEKEARHSSTPPAQRTWPESVVTTQSPATEDAPFVFDDIDIPVPNPWKRNVRLAGFDFFPDGSAAFCTFDGDIWLVDGLEEGSDKVTWSRFASGLHDPKSVCIVDGEIYVSDRNGIVRLHDTDDNGEADWFENFSNVVPQTGETREFAMDMIAIPEGGFYLAKGGQVASTRGLANGIVARVSPDGRSYETIATGLRQPYIGYDPATGILTSSDQQGHWKPATPVYRIEKGKYYGFQPSKFKDEAVHPAPIAPPEVWIPHFINPSAASQVWMKNGTKMGALDEALVLIGYNRPEIFKIYLDKNRRQGAAFPVLAGFPSGVIKGRVHPIDGRLYLSGFEIWGTSAERISGLFRVRPTGEDSWIPREIEAGERGVLLSFDHELSPELAADPGRYSIDRWNYRQTHNYGSGNFKLDGEPGQESVPLASAQLSKDRKSLFLGLPDMRPSHSLRVTYRIPVADSTQVESAYLTVHSLEKIDLTSRGFESDEIDMTPKQSLAGAEASVEPSADLGKETAVRYGCIACHATGEPGLPVPSASAADGSEVAVGPAWTGLWKTRREFTDGSFIRSVDETYLRESILDPERRVAEGYETEATGVGMPSYLGVLKDHEIESIILYIQSLEKKKAKG